MPDMQQNIFSPGKNKAIRLMLPLIAVFCLSNPVSFSQMNYGEMKNAGLFKKKLNETTQSINTLESAFTQEKNLSVISEKIVSSGLFYFKKEKLLRWEYTEPFSYIIIINNDQMLVKDEAKVTRFDARSNRLFSEINNIILGCVRGTILTEDKKFKVTLMESNDFNLVKLHPLTPQLKEFFIEIRIFFDKIEYTVTRLELQESSGDFTRIEFQGKKINNPIPDENFLIK